MLALLIATGALVALLAWRPRLALDAEFARQRWRAGARLHRIEVAGHRWSYLQVGDPTRPTLVLVHGFTGSKENWLPLLRVLGHRYRVIVPDLPGWGASERRTDADYGYRAQAERLVAFIARLAAAPVVLVGHSMGGGIAVLAAEQAPQRIERLVLMDAAGVRFADNAFGLAVLAGEHPFAVSDAPSLRRVMALVFARPPWLPWPFSSALIRQRRADAAFERRVLQAISGDADAFLPGERAAHLRLPVLLLWCRDDPVIDVSAMDLYAAQIPHAQRVVLACGGHMPMADATDATAAALIAFVADASLAPTPRADAASTSQR